MTVLSWDTQTGQNWGKFANLDYALGLAHGRSIEERPASDLFARVNSSFDAILKLRLNDISVQVTLKTYQVDTAPCRSF